MELVAGRVNASSGAYAGTARVIKTNPNLKVKPIEGLVFNFTPFAFATPPREYFFRDYVNTVIGNLEASGKLAAIKDAWTKVE